VHVRPQAANEGFVLLLPDGSIEVRGTTFDVTVENGRTRAVHVDEGIVELRLRGQSVRRLLAGEAWPPSEPAPANPPVFHAPDAAPRTVASAPIAATSGDDGRALAYSSAIALLTAGRNDEAAVALHAFFVSHPDAPQAEDASFLEAVALARAGRIDAAGLVAEDHLARFPSSFHEKEAAQLVERAARWRDAGR
jgi:TolA-binding protein